MEEETAEIGGDAHAGPAPARSTPSLLRYSPALIFFIIVITDVGRWADPDLWGHLRFGQLALELGHAPRHDRYSYSVPGHPWYDSEWLAESLLAFSYDRLGVIGLKLMKILCTAVTVLMMALAAAETGAAVRIQLVVLMVAGLALVPTMQFRPQLFTFMLLGALMALLARDSFRRRDAAIWLAVPIFALWANLHGGFAAGMATFALYAGVRSLEDLVGGRGLRQAIRLGGVTLASAAATLVNPYGIENWLAIIFSIRNPITRAVLSEWQPLLFKIVQEWRQSPATAINFAVVIVLPVALAICFAIRPRGGDLPLVAIAAMMAVGGYLSLRHAPLVVIVTVAPLCRHAALVLESTRYGQPPPVERRTTANELVVAALAALIAIETGLFSRTLPAGFAVPKGAVDFMKTHALKGNVLNDYTSGEYLIWRMAPESKVFIDGRYDSVYPLKVITDYFDFYLDRPRAAAVLKDYPHDFVLITPFAPVRKLMKHQPDWKLIYSDPDSLLYARADSPAARLAGVPVRGKHEPAFFP